MNAQIQFSRDARRADHANGLKHAGIGGQRTFFGPVNVRAKIIIFFVSGLRTMYFRFSIS